MVVVSSVVEEVIQSLLTVVRISISCGKKSIMCVMNINLEKSVAQGSTGRFADGQSDKGRVTKKQTATQMFLP